MRIPLIEDEAIWAPGFAPNVPSSSTPNVPSGSTPNVPSSITPNGPSGLTRTARDGTGNETGRR
jgi:hypothetical protein